MFIIKEEPANKLPNLTSLYINIGNYINNQHIKDSLTQQNLKYHDRKTGVYELPLNRLFFLVRLLIPFDDVQFIPYKQKEIEFKKCDPNSFKVKPYDYQLEGINYGLSHNGWLLLDDQGLGKTLQMIYLAETLYRQGELEHCFIVCGVNGLKYNWMREIKKSSDLSCEILGRRTTRTGRNKICSVEDRIKILKEPIKEFFVITNLETLQNKNFAEAFTKGPNKFDMIVLDEAHKCKNPTALATSNLLELKSKRNIALTGTMIMNTPENAYVPLKWTGNLNCTYSQFCQMYNIYGGYGGVQVIGYKNLDLLREHISSCSLRRLKSEVLDLPEKVFTTEYVELLPKQRALYDEVEKGIAEELDLLPNKRMTIVQEMTINMRLRQITAWPGIVSSEVNQSAKLDRLEELVEQIISQDHKVVVFSSFKGTIPEVAKRLEKYGTLVCTGDESDEVINNNKELFETDPEKRVFVGTWQKMGTGHTLTTANYLIFIDTPWTDADFKQASDRVHRIGQDKTVFIITLVAKDTYDERVLEIVEKKEKLSDYVINQSDNGLVQVVDYE